MPIKYVELSILIVLAVTSDIKSSKIRNILTIPFIILGVMTNFAVNGLFGLRDSLIGSAIPFLALFLLFVYKMLSAGDIKLFCAVGSIMGVSFIINTIILSFLAGGIIGLIAMAARKNFKARMKYFFNYLKTCFLTLSLPEYKSKISDEKSGCIKFSYAIAAGVILSFKINFLL